jgi:hypothetical protein
MKAGYTMVESSAFRSPSAGGARIVPERRLYEHHSAHIVYERHLPQARGVAYRAFYTPPPI